MKCIAVLIALLVLVLVCSSFACGGNDETAIAPSPIPTPTLIPTVSLTPATPQTIPEETQSRGDVVITIGNLSDVTGVASSALNVVTMALEDLAKFYNDVAMIPGIEFEVITYDTQYNPDLDVTGYEWLIEHGADVIFTPVTSAVATLKSRLEQERMVLFTVVPTEESIVPPGYVFCSGNASGREVSFTTLDWIAENDPDFPEDRPAQIGGAYWTEAYAQEILKGAEEYAAAHPDKYEWVGSYLEPFTFNWGEAVEALKDCDYVLPPVPTNQFAREYRDSGYMAKFVGTDAHLVFLDRIAHADLWDELDGMLFVKPGRWWNEDDELIDLIKILLQDNHPDIVNEIRANGSGYLTIRPLSVMFSLIAETVKAVGPQNFSSQAIYDEARSFSMTIDGIEMYSFNETKRVSSNYLGVYELNAAERDIFRITPEWYPIVRSP